MEKTINIEGKDIRLNNNIGWVMEYRNQFNRDILPTLMPMIAGAIDAVATLIENTGKTGDIEVADVVEVVKSEDFFDALIKITSFEFVDLLNITWALAKTADETIPEPNNWVREIGSFPIDEIGPQIFELILSGVVSSKNWERLQKAVKGLKPKTETEEKKTQ